MRSVEIYKQKVQDCIKYYLESPNNIVKTSEVEWLERDQTIVDVRRNKLKRILKDDESE